ncbi:ArnT family glycosyltransferase [Flagellimonas sp. 2504JD4-2]
MKKYLPLILTLSIIKLVIHCIGNQNYGFHRDELLHVSVGEHLDWGFMEFPPMIAVLGKISVWLFGHSLSGLRLFPTLAGVGILILCCYMAKELGGKLKAVLIAGVCILSFLPFYRNHTLFQPVAFDQLFWTLGFYFVIRFINSNDKKFLVFTGITLGIGLMNKYTMLVWAFGLTVGLLFYQKGKLFKNPWLYISGLISLLILLPNIIWQFEHDFPLLKHMQALSKFQLDKSGSFDFVSVQASFPFTLVVSLFGLSAFLIDERLKKYRAVGISTLVIFFALWLLKSKAYYLFAIYPVLFAAGAVKIESLLSKKPRFVYIIVGLLLISSVGFIPKAAPILPIESFVAYQNLEEKNGRIKLTNDYADMFGWEEQVKLVDSVYRSFETIQPNDCVIWAENYGEAGAIKILGKKHGLPNPISRHGSFWSWGYGNKNAKVWISIGNEKNSVESVFEEVTLIKTITHKYAIEEENEIPLYICRKPKVDIDTWWKDYEKHIFD